MKFTPRLNTKEVSYHQMGREIDFVSAAVRGINNT